MKSAIIGLGRIGFDFSLDPKRVQPASHYGCLRYLEMNKKLEGIAICDSDSFKLARAKSTLISSTCPSFTNVHEMMMNFKPELVCIATPTPTHRTIVDSVASYSFVKGIFLEKPIAESLEDAEEIIKICKEKNIILSVNYSRRWDPVYRAVKTEIDESLIAMVGYHPGPLLRTGTHMIDLFLNYLNDPITIQAIGSPIDNYLTKQYSYLDDYSINGVFTFSDNKIAWLIAGLETDYLMFELDLIFVNQRIRILNNGTNFECYLSVPSSRYDGIKELVPKAILTETSPSNPLLSGISELLDICEHADANINISNSCTGEDAYKTLQATLALHYSSSIENQQITFEEIKFHPYKVKSY